MPLTPLWQARETAYTPGLRKKAPKSFTCPQWWHVSVYSWSKRQVTIQIPCGVRLFSDYKGCRCQDKRYYNIVKMEGLKETGLGCVCSVGICEKNKRVIKWGTPSRLDSGLLMYLSATHFAFLALTFCRGWKDTFQKSSSWWWLLSWEWRKVSSYNLSY